MIIDIKSVKQKQDEVNEARRLYKEGNPIETVAKIMHHNPDTIKRYIDPNFKVVDPHFDMRFPGKLAPFRDEVIELREKGHTYPEIKEIIAAKGYDGSVAALRMMMQKERMYAKFTELEGATGTEYVQRNILCRTIYTKPDDVVQITKGQYQLVLDKYPTLRKVFDLVADFKKIIFSKQADSLKQWIDDAKSLDIKEINTFVEGVKRDLDAIKNGIMNKYSNGLAEGSVNKIKVIKRIMYGRNSFELLRTKTLLREQFFFNLN